MSPPSEPSLSRVERKEQTRRAVLDAALALAADGGLSAVALRQVAKEAGIVPTAFYRHFASIEDLGLALVDEAFVVLRAMLREVRAAGASPTFAQIIDNSVQVLVDHVGAEKDQFAFIARERFAGPPAVRAAIWHEIELCERELATDLARLPGTREWSSKDLQVLTNLIVSAVVATAEDLVRAGDRRSLAEAVADRARTQLRMLVIGAQSLAVVLSETEWTHVHRNQRFITILPNNSPSAIAAKALGA